MILFESGSSESSVGGKKGLGREWVNIFSFLQKENSIAILELPK